MYFLLCLLLYVKNNNKKVGFYKICKKKSHKNTILPSYCFLIYNINHIYFFIKYVLIIFFLLRITKNK